MTTQKINIAEKFGKFNETWSPKIIADFNNQFVKLAKFSGEFVWHQHDNEDELFLVIQGELLIKFKTHDVRLAKGEMLVVPKGVQHCPVALSDEVHVMLIEPKSTQQTGNTITDETIPVEEQEWI